MYTGGLKAKQAIRTCRAKAIFAGDTLSVVSSCKFTFHLRRSLSFTVAKQSPIFLSLKLFFLPFPWSWKQKATNEFADTPLGSFFGTKWSANSDGVRMRSSSGVSLLTTSFVCLLRNNLQMHVSKQGQGTHRIVGYNKQANNARFKLERLERTNGHLIATKNASVNRCNTDF